MAELGSPAAGWRAPSDRPYDVAVIGGGPSGATAARLLREWGHSVVLLARAAGHRPPLAESVPPSARKVLAAVGALAWVEGHGFLPTTGNTSWWASHEPQVERFPTAGFQVLRDELEAVLLAGATRAGVETHEEFRVREVRFDAAEAVVVHGERQGRGPSVLRAGEILDASGRAGVVAGEGFRSEQGPPTLALSAVWRRDSGFPVPDDSHTLVEAFASGWAWSVPVSRGVRHVTVMVDPPAPGRARRDPGALYADALGQARHLQALVAGAERVGAAWALDASTYSSRRFEASRLLLVGDAASFIDPLSSFGVKKALASAWLAAVATHTGLRHPERAEMARAFFSRREEQIYARYAREAARHARSAARRYAESAFWSARAVGPPPGAEPDAPLATDAAIQAAFDDVKTRRRLRLGLGAGVRMGPAPLVVEHEIELAESLLTATGDPVHSLEGVQAARLARLAPGHDDVGRLFEAYAAQAPGAGLGEFLRALATLIAAGLLRPE